AYRGSYAYFAESGNCLFSSSTKWVIDSSASDHMTEVSKSLVGLSSSSPFEAHCRLGHLSLQSLKKLCPECSHLSSLNCDSSEFAKHKRVHLSPRANKQAASLFEPAQNEIAKCKNHHMLEVARALLFQMTVPKPFWVDSPSTACFLINRMPFAVLGGNYPYLSHIQNGYRCYSPQLHRYLVSRDVTFHKDLPYFPVTTYRHQEENDDLLVYVSPTHVETTKQSAKLDGLPLKVYARRPRIRSDLIRKPSTQLKDAPSDAPNDVSNDAPNDVSNDAPNDVSNNVPISAPSEACGKSDVPIHAASGSDSPPPSLTPELDLSIAL
nr:cysteine-rich RLK (receptor-like protein kinase) 8 [Tanacetum cinerariifolium]